MYDVSTLESEVAKLIVRTLTLKVDPAWIQPEGPLFGDSKASATITMVATAPHQHMCGLESSVMFPFYATGDS